MYRVSTSDPGYLHRLARFAVAAVLLSPAAAFFSPEAAWCDHIANPVDVKLNVVVREVQADGLLPEHESTAVGQVDHSLKDLEPQLQRLNYANYRLVESHNFVVPPRKKETISLRGGNSLTVRPLGIDGDKICVWIKWRGKGGMEILDTRMRFVAGESMITGTEKNEDAGLILAIDVKPVDGVGQAPESAAAPPAEAAAEHAAP